MNDGKRNKGGRPLGAKSRMLTPQKLAKRAMDEVERGILQPITVVLDVMRGLDQRGKPIMIELGDEWIVDPKARPYSADQKAMAVEALPFTTPKLVAVKMQVQTPPDPKAELLPLMTSDEKRQLLELMESVERRAQMQAVETTAVDVDEEDANE